MKYILFSLLFIVSPLTQAQALCPMTSAEVQQSCLDEKLQSAIDHMVSNCLL